MIVSRSANGHFPSGFDIVNLGLHLSSRPFLYVEPLRHSAASKGKIEITPAKKLVAQNC